MPSLISEVRQAAYQATFQRSASFGGLDIQEIAEVLENTSELHEKISNHVTDLEAIDTEIFEKTQKAIDKIGAAMKLCEINNLPDHFKNAFSGCLQAAKDVLMEVKANEAGKHLSDMATALFTSSIGDEM